MIKDYDAIVWSPQSEKDLDDILEYYLEFSPEKAHEYIIEILEPDRSDMIERNCIPFLHRI